MTVTVVAKRAAADDLNSGFAKRKIGASKPATGWLREGDCSLDDFKAIVSEQKLSVEDVPLASEIVSNVPIYVRATLPLDSPEKCERLAAEWMENLLTGSGIICIRGAFAPEELSVVDATSSACWRIIASERAATGARGDHFAKPGTNSRIWNSQEKLARHCPRVFVDYFSNPVLALASRAWLGPNYQMTSQVNVVHPGGVCQAVHRDFHLGFLTNAEAEKYPAHVHEMSAKLTLQGAVAHCDMPLESGPTLYLPYSQKYPLGYLAWRQPDFNDYFKDNFVQLPLNKGDAVFFNPALFHAAGSNTSQSIDRMALLLQVSSAFGRAMETVDRTRLSLGIYPHLLEASMQPGWSNHKTAAVIAAAAEGYAFPTNLDRDQPVGGLAPESQAAVMSRAIAGQWSSERFEQELRDHSHRRQSV